MLHRSSRRMQAVVSALTASALILLAIILYAGNPVTTEASVDRDQLDTMNEFYDLSTTSWFLRYDDLRTDSRYGWMDWSNDECSAPPPIPRWFVRDFLPVCLRHDLTWRSLPIIDDETGRVWNERNRYVADRQFRDDTRGICRDLYSLSGSAYLRLECEASSLAAYLGIRGQYQEATTEEKQSASRNSGYIQYPSASARVNCAPTTGRCLPIQFATLDGRPFSPQNIPYIKTGKVVELEVVRAHQLYGDGPPSRDGLNFLNRRGDYTSTGELTLKVNYPIRASFTQAIGCSSTATQALPVESSTYRPAENDEDQDWREKTIYIKSCRDTRSSEEDYGLIEFFPREARYVWREDFPEYQDGDRFRHYQNIRADGCHTTEVEAPVEVRGSLLPTDCSTTQTQGGYADYYTFEVDRTGTYQIDLMRQEEYVDTYLYLLNGNRTTGSIVEKDDDGGTRSGNSRITRSLRRGDYTVVVTNYGVSRIRTGDYLLRIRETDDCPAKPILEEETEGEWTRDDCESTRRDDTYVDYYTFEVEGTRSRSVTIDLDSREDTYLFLISGDSAAGTDYIERDDDGGPGRDARIRRTLRPGSYTIAATTYYEHERDDYTLEVSGLDLP